MIIDIILLILLIVSLLLLVGLVTKKFPLGYDEKQAGVVELVDTHGLGPCAQKAWRFKSSPRHHITMKSVMNLG